MKDPFRIEAPTCISFSGGRTSGYMLWRVLQSNGGLPPEARVCFANTGLEAEETLEFVRDCQQNWGIPITWLEFRHDENKYAVVDFDTASRNGEPFEALIEKKSYLPNPVSRFCTTDLKMVPMDLFLNDDGSLMMIGVRADEQRRLPKMRARGLLVPLADAGVVSKDVHQFWSSNGFDLKLKFNNGVTPLGNCSLCFLKGRNQLQSIIGKHPSLADWWVRMEKKVGATFRSDRPSYEAMQSVATSQIDAFGYEETIPCFCGD